MPRLREILSDGPEHPRRTIRRAALGRSLAAELRRRERLLGRLGRLAWERGVPESKTAPAGTRLTALYSRMNKKTGKLRREVARLESEIAEAEDLAKEEKRNRHRASQKLESSLRLRSQRKKSAYGIEGDLKAGQRKRKRLRDDLALCRRRFRQLKLNANAEKGNRGGATGLLATDELLRSRLDEIERELKVLQGRRLASRRAAQKLDETISAIGKKREESAGRLRELREQRRALGLQLGRARKELERILVPFRTQEAGLFRDLAEDLLKSRTDEPEFAPHFSSLDLCASTIENLENDIRSETVLLDQLNTDAVIAFYGIVAGAGFLALFLVTLVIALLIILL